MTSANNVRSPSFLPSTEKPHFPVMIVAWEEKKGRANTAYYERKQAYSE